MASQGPLAPTAASNQGAQTPTWTSVNNIFADDAAVADVSYSSSGPSKYLASGGYGFTIPDQTIQGIVVELDEEGITSGSCFDELSLTKDGTNSVGTAKSAFGNFDPWMAYGSSTDLWGTTWTPAEINASTFGTMLQLVRVGGLVGSSIDAIRVTVYYGPAVTLVSQLQPSAKLRRTRGGF